jgi:arylsulfatase A-like enzyme
MINLVDIFATLAAVVGESRLDPNTTAPDSYNVLPALLGASAKPLRPEMILQGEHGVYAIRSGPWKWIEGIPVPRPGWKLPLEGTPAAEQLKPQLFHLPSDVAETRDVSDRHREKVEQLAARLALQRQQGRSRE